jgi:hypothetical protein
MHVLRQEKKVVNGEANKMDVNSVVIACRFTAEIIYTYLLNPQQASIYSLHHGIMDCEPGG